MQQTTSQQPPTAGEAGRQGLATAANGTSRAPVSGGHRLGFGTLERECTLAPIPLQGELPGWLNGSLLRTGPAKFEVGANAYRHWFDGLAMLHRFAVSEGGVSYANRFLHSRAWRAAREQGEIAYSEFATDPCRSLFKRVATLFKPAAFGDNANVNITALDGEFIALTETPLPVRFDPETLETLGVGAPAPGQLTVAHPHRSPRTGELVSYATSFGPRTSYKLYTQRPGGSPQTFAKLPVSRPSYMHSFAITERHAVLVEFPFVALPAAIALSGRPFIENYRWRPELGTRIQVIELDTGRLTARCETEPLFAFHHVNAFEAGEELVIDMCAYENADVVDCLYLDQVRQEHPTLPDAQLLRCRVPRNGGSVSHERLAERGLELPRIDYGACNGRPYEFVYGSGRTESGDFLDEIVKIDVNSGERTSWHEPGCYPGEPVYVARPGARAQDDGVLLSVVLDAAAADSFLLVLDARELGELARARVPHAIPFGFHGQFARGV